MRFGHAALAAQAGVEPGRRTGTRDAGASSGPIALPSLLGGAFAPVPVRGRDVNNRHVTGLTERYM
ncbi:hypothetical protein GCM10009864_18140 [Streptomyces lunalinharesii]|uniref:Uncharacterized protein n=1 Tax=Streptomyces lunalinharesii TaxID=333384 RepID=A0ABN3RJ99_9ACTN